MWETSARGNLGSLSGTFFRPVQDKRFGSQSIRAALVNAVEIATEERVKRLGATVACVFSAALIVGW
jgi:hypothetical protein